MGETYEIIFRYLIIGNAGQWPMIEIKKVQWLPSHPCILSGCSFLIVQTGTPSRITSFSWDGDTAIEFE